MVVVVRGKSSNAKLNGEEGGIRVHPSINCDFITALISIFTSSDLTLMLPFLIWPSVSGRIL